uniref:Cyclic nucleotide-gated olfactory channel (inferred by orthology to a human protein) n=1 Tax=Strongyloides venezuelensis TaxID=75913 RepID=A0A0K0FCC2_STRVS
MVITSNDLESNKWRNEEVKEMEKKESNVSFKKMVMMIIIIRNWISKALKGKKNNYGIDAELSEKEKALFIDNIFGNDIEEKDPLYYQIYTTLICGNKAFRQRLKDTFALFTVSQTSTFYYYWTFIVTLAIAYNLVFICVFIFREAYENYFNEWLLVNQITDVIYIIDMICHSRKEFLEDGILRNDGYKMLKRYFKSKIFIFDVISILPTDFIVKYHYLLVFARINTLTRVYRISDFINMTDTRTNWPHLFRVIKLISVCFIIFHWNGCFYFLISIAYNYQNATIEDWVYSFDKIADPRVPNCDPRFPEVENCFMNESYNMAYNRNDYLDELDLFWENKTRTIPFGNLTKKYQLSFYWSALTLVTLGEQAWPNNTFQMCFEILDTLVGLCVFAAIVGDVGNMISSMNEQKSRFEERLDGCKQYMRYRNVRPQLNEKIIEWFHYTWRSNIAKVDEESIVELLPRQLYGQLAISNHMKTLSKVKLFQDCEIGVLYEIILRLKPRIFSPQDYVCKKGDVGNEMYIIESGNLEVVSEDGNVIFVTLEKGAVFGELALLNIPGSKHGNKRTASIRSKGYSQLYGLSKDDLWECINEFPNAKNILIEKGKEILRKDNLLDENMESNLFEECRSTEDIYHTLLYYVKNLEEKIDDINSTYKNGTRELKQKLTMLEKNYKVNKKKIKMDYERKKNQTASVWEKR